MRTHACDGSAVAALGSHAEAVLQSKGHRLPHSYLCCVAHALCCCSQPAAGRADVISARRRHDRLDEREADGPSDHADPADQPHRASIMAASAGSCVQCVVRAGGTVRSGGSVEGCTCNGMAATRRAAACRTQHQRCGGHDADEAALHKVAAAGAARAAVAAQSAAAPVGGQERLTKTAFDVLRGFHAVWWPSASEAAKRGLPADRSTALHERATPPSAE